MDFLCLFSAPQAAPGLLLPWLCASGHFDCQVLRASLLNASLRFPGYLLTKLVSGPLVPSDLPVNPHLYTVGAQTWSSWAFTAESQSFRWGFPSSSFPSLPTADATSPSVSHPPQSPLPLGEPHSETRHSVFSFLNWAGILPQNWVQF